MRGCDIGATVRRRSAAAPRRERIMAAIVEVVAERGHSDASVTAIVERAGVSRRTFYELFPGGLDDGLIAVMDWVLVHLRTLISRRLKEGSSWQEGGLRALAALLLFFDADRALAQVSFVETLAGAAVRGHRERNVRILRALIVAQLEPAGMRVSPLAAEMTMASLMGMIYAHLANAEQAPLIGLLGQLMGAAVMPFVPGEHVALAEIRRGEELARKIQAGDPEWGLAEEMILWGSRGSISVAGRGDGRRDDFRPAVLANPDAGRARECLLYMSEHPNSSNAEIAAGIGVVHRSQISRLLSEMAGEELVLRRSEGVGRRNSWRVSARGEAIARKLRSAATAGA